MRYIAIPPSSGFQSSRKHAEFDLNLYLVRSYGVVLIGGGSGEIHTWWVGVYTKCCYITSYVNFKMHQKKPLHNSTAPAGYTFGGLPHPPPGGAARLRCSK